MAKHDIVLLNTTSSGFETDLGSNVARIKGDANNLLSVRDNSNINKFSISSVEDSMVVSGDLTLSGNLSSSLSSTASFGRIDVTNLVGDASLMTNTNEIGHVSSSAQLAARISGAFQHGFELEGENRVISGSATSTGSFTRVFSNVYSGDASDMFGVNESGHFSGSAQLASNISGSFNKGFTFEGLIGTETPPVTATQSIKLDESDDFLKINPIFVSGSEGDDKLYGERRFTLSMWLKFNGDNGSRNTFIMAGAQSGALSGLYLWMQSNSITGEFKIKQGSTMQTANLSGIGGIEIGKWHHLLLSYESNRPTPNVSGSFLSALDGKSKTFKVMQSGSYITTTEPPGGGSTIGTYNVSSENTNMTVADITMWKHSIQSASSDAGIDSGSLITTLFNHGIVPDYTASFSTDYPDAYREKLKFAFNFDSSSYAGSSYSMYDRTGNTGFALTSNNVDEGKIVSGSGDYPTEGVFYTTGSFGRVVIGGVITGDASQVTGVDAALPSGVISSSAQVATAISGAFTSGFQMEGTLSGSTSNSTASFGRYDFGSSITITDVSELTGVPSSEGFLSSSAQIASKISGSFNKGFEFDGTISGSATSTGSFQKLNFKSISVTDVSGITNHEAGHITGSGGIASEISASIESGYDFTGLLSGSSDSTLIVHKLDLSTGTFNIPNKKLTKNWNSSYVRVASFGDSLASSISGSFSRGFGFTGQISGSTKTTGSFHRTHIKEIFTKNIFTGVRKSVSGSMDHDNYITSSFKTDSSRPINIPVRGRVDHTMVTKQFTATGSMESQKYRNQAGQLFIDNWGRLNMTVQTGSMVQQPSAWTLIGSGEALGGRFGGMIAQSTKAALVLPSTGMAGNCTRIFDGITVFGGANLPYNISYCGWSHGYQGLGNGVDDALQAGAGFGGGTGCNASIYDGSAWASSAKLVENLHSSNGQPKAFNAPGVTTGGGGALVGGTNKNKVYQWTGVSWEIGGTRNVNIGGGGAAGSVYAGVAFGGKVYPSPAASTCTEEYNGVSWATATAMPHELDTLGAGTQNAAALAGGGTVAPHTHGPFLQSDDTFEYNGTSWNTAPDMLSYMSQHNIGGGTGTLISGPGLGGWSNGIGAIFEPAFVTGSSDTYNNFQPSANGDGRYLLTKKLQANYSPGCAGGPVTSGSSDNFGYGGGY